MSDKAIRTLSEFLLQAQTQYLVLDLGRGIRKIDNQTFFEWENQQQACSFPRQDHGWFCIVFWNEQLSQERYIWFIKLPLDERGLIIQASRNQFLEIVVQALGTQLEHKHKKQAELPENPYLFVPSQQQLADCNAQIKRSLSIQTPLSDMALKYIKTPELTNWQALSVQEIANLVCFSDDNLQSLLANNLTRYASPFLSCLFASLESKAISPELTRALINFHDKSTDSAIAALCLRAMSFAPNTECVNYIKRLGVKTLDIDTCIVITGRFWSLFTDGKFLSSFMHQVVSLEQSQKAHKEAELFKSLYADLVKIPAIRHAMLGFLRDEKRSELVAKAIGELFNA